MQIAHILRNVTAQSDEMAFPWQSTAKNWLLQRL
jgi:hypothetical protein